MSTIVIVSFGTAILALIGLKVYFEHKEEKALENANKEDVFADLQAFVINPQESTITPVAIEEKPENKPVADTPDPAVSTEPIKKAKPKKKRYYHPKKTTSKKQTNKTK